MNIEDEFIDMVIEFPYTIMSKFLRNDYITMSIRCVIYARNDALRHVIDTGQIKTWDELDIYMKNKITEMGGITKIDD